MRIQLLSDLHLESHPHFQPRPAPGADVLVLAGDIGSYQTGSGLTDADFGLARFSPLAAWPTPVLFIPGNHEYDALDFDATHMRLRETCTRLGITWLEREVVTLTRPVGDPVGQGSVRFIGTTLWSDFDALALLGKAKDNLTEQLRLRGKAFRAADFYLRKAATVREGAPWLAEQVMPSVVARNVVGATRRAGYCHRGRHPLCPQPAQRRPPVWADPFYRRVLQCTGRLFRPSRLLAARPPALP
jgi:hypothetical protein